MAEFLTDIETLRYKARAEIEKGPITPAYGADLDRVIAVLNEALATEIGRAHSQYTTAHDLIEMIKENLVAERIAIASYTEIIGWLGDGDVTTRRLFEDVLAVEEEHADDMITFLEQMA
jgi:bacterioferritin (cytochrome b1)